MKSLTIAILLTITGCAAKQIIPGAATVMLSNEKPSAECVFLGEITGGQGNSWTDDITTTKNIIQGSRNDLRNNGFKLGANYIHIHPTVGLLNRFPVHQSGYNPVV